MGMDTKLTPAQVNTLRYHAHVETSNKRRAENLPRGPMPKGVKPAHDPRPIQALCDLGLMEVVGYHYGPNYALTQAGRDTLKSLGF